VHSQDISLSLQDHLALKGVPGIWYETYLKDLLDLTALPILNVRLYSRMKRPISAGQLALIYCYYHLLLLLLAVVVQYINQPMG
jgi:hypothetical protein